MVGDLVIDSYLRFRPSPYFSIKDRFVLTLLWQTHSDIRRANDFFIKYKPSFYISSLTTYVQHGIPVRVALKVGVPVYLVSSHLVFGKKLSLDDYFHTADASSYCSIFKKLERQKEKLNMAEAQLKYRFSGGLEDEMVYMKSSSYAPSNEKLPNIKGSVVIYLHDFYDSPHVYDEFIFPDFWSWICFTIDTFIQSEISFLVKPHPNQISLSESVVQLLLQQYPELQIISSNITNTELVDKGMTCGVTVYGSVAHELAYMGVPTICCAKHPHNSFDFCRTAKGLDEYKYLLQTTNIQPLPLKEMQRQALAFFYMHNIYGGEAKKALTRVFSAWWVEAQDIDGTELVQKLVKFRSLSIYNKLIEDLVKELQICSTKKLVDQHD